MQIAIMIEGQNGLTWERWQRIAQTVEDAGFAGLYRSDHYTNATPPDKESLECWVSLTWLASHTKRIEFGSLVSPFSFRHPAMLARMAASVDDLSGGRLTLGLGAGWQEREHTNFGLDLMGIPQRFARFEEGLEVTKLLLTSTQPVSFNGTYYHLHDAVLLPRPVRPAGPSILIGGNGKTRTLPLVAKYADEWNAVFTTAPHVAELNQHLNNLLVKQGRKPSEVHRSLMTGCIYGDNDAALNQKRQLYSSGKASLDELRERGMIVGAANAIVDQVGKLSDAGIYRVMLQWLDLEDIKGLEQLAAQVLPQLKS